MAFNNHQSVTKIEYYGPHQIQTTSIPSVNFSVKMDTNLSANSRNYEEEKVDLLINLKPNGKTDK